MEASFWHGTWEQNKIAFHEHVPNRLMVANFKLLSLPKGARVFVPLCGKSLDVHWLLSNGYRVAGAELSKIAIEQLFAELHVKPTITAMGKTSHWSADGIDIFVGDIFDLSRGDLGQVEAIYDRAALVAFPEDMRGRYAAHLMEIADCAPQLVICFEYDQRRLDGPPFSVGADQVARYYQASYDSKLLVTVDVPGGLKGQCPATETVWLLTRREARS
jgi:thiopurine S-methyltransferase